MKGLGKVLILLSIIFTVLLGYQIVAYFGMELGLAVISMLFMGGIALSLVLSGSNSGQDELFMEEFWEDFRKN